MPKKLITAKEIAGKYYIVYKENVPADKIADEETIIGRIDRLTDYLARAKTSIRAMDVCRSSYSGYLPSSRAAFVEREFLARVRRIVDLEYLE